MTIRAPGRRPSRRPWLTGQLPQPAPPVLEARAPLVMNTPRAAQLGSVDFIPNLLLTTLAVDAAVLPVGKRLTESAPQARQQICQPDQSQHPLTLGLNPQPAVQRLDQPAPATKYQVQCEPPLAPLTLVSVRLPRAPLVLNAPPPSRLGAVDVFPNLLQSTLGIAVPLPSVQRLDQSAPAPKFQVFVDQPTFRPLTLGLNPQPAALQLNDSAPPPKVAVYVDQPVFRPLTLGLNPQPLALRVDQSAPVTKPAVQVDAYPNLLATTLKPPVPAIPIDTAQWQGKFAVTVDTWPNVLARGFNPQPAVLRLDQPAPATKFAVQVDAYPNLIASTLKTLAVAAPFLPVDVAQFQGKFAVQADVYPNVLLRGYNPQPAVQRLDASAPPPKAAVTVDQPLTRPLTVATAPPLPQIQRLDTSAPPPKSAVFVDQPVFHPLTLGINPQPGVLRIDYSAPAPRFAVQVDSYPNLLASTLKPVGVPFTPLDTAQVQPKYGVASDIYPNVLIRGYNLQPQPQRLEWPAPAPKAQVYVDQPPRPLTLAPIAAPIPPLQPLPVDTPRVRWLGSVDIGPNLLATTLTLQPAGQRLSDSAPQWRFISQPDPAQRPLTLGINPQPFVLRWDSSAPFPKYQVQLDQPLLRPITLTALPPDAPQRRTVETVQRRDYPLVAHGQSRIVVVKDANRQILTHTQNRLITAARSTRARTVA